MGVSMIDVQRTAILQAIRDVGHEQWHVLVVDDTSWRLIQNVLNEDDILSEKITNIERIEQPRNVRHDTDAIYLLSPEPHVVDCLMADFERRRYRRASLLWTSLLHPSLRERIDRSSVAQEQILTLQVLDVGFYPRESHLVTFRDPWSFPILYHPACNNLVKQHISNLAQKIVSVCVSLGEYPNIRYYRPRSTTHEASVLCSHLAHFVQGEIDMYATYHNNFPPSSNRPRATLYIVDRSMDLISPIVHEFTYQAMIHDLLTVKEGDKVSYRMTVNQGQPDEHEKDVEIKEKDKIWLANRHMHMKDTIEKLMAEFQKFIENNPHFTKTDVGNANSLNAIKDMLAGLPQFQETKEAYSLHLTMAQESMNIFQRRRLADLASVEQTLATGIDEELKKPRNVADQLVRILDEESITQPDRLRLILLYLLYRDGLLSADINKLLAHAQLPPDDGEVVRNLSLLGARIGRSLKEKGSPQPLLARKQPPSSVSDGYALSRFSPALKFLLEEHAKGSLDQEIFPYTKPQLDASDSSMREVVPSASLRSAKPTWAKGRSSAELHQRIIVFIAGGATYSESRTCYEASNDLRKDVYLVTSHMITPSLFLRQVGDLSVDKRRLLIPAEQPKPKAPAWLSEPDPPPPKPKASIPADAIPPASAMAKLGLDQKNGSVRPPGGSQAQRNNDTTSSLPTTGSGKSVKDEEKKKKKFGLFSSKK